MDKLTHLLFCLVEECAEVIKPLCKSGRFGLYNKNPKTGLINIETIQEEMHDIIGVYKMICDEIGVDFAFDENKFEKKKEKVLKYMEYVRDAGTLDKICTNPKCDDGYIDYGKQTHHACLDCNPNWETK